jgi:hypothetical protein
MIYVLFLFIQKLLGHGIERQFERSDRSYSELTRLSRKLVSVKHIVVNLLVKDILDSSYYRYLDL